MNCANHIDTPAAAYCRTCGKPLCATCKHDVRGVIYCEDCIANRLSDTMPAATPAGATVVPGTGPAVVVAPADTGPSPALAALLGFIPGVGAMYNGQFVKGLVHVLIFASLIWGTDHAGSADVFFGMGIAFWVFYMVFDAYKTAHARQTGEPLPDPFGFERLWGGSPAQPPRPIVAEPGAPIEAQPQEEFRHAPVGAVALVALGALFLLNTTGVFYSWNWFGRFWPVILIVVGVWTWMRRQPPTTQP